MDTIAAQVAAQSQEAGYRVEHVERLRSNRWLLTLSNDSGSRFLLLAQQRALVGASDVQDLAELLRLGPYERGFLLAVDGAFSPAAQRTAVELGARSITLCLSLPAASTPPHAAPALEPL